jgi:acyl-coenzyme A synthetase/AMP-(fatty) acid ligase
VNGGLPELEALIAHGGPPERPVAFVRGERRTWAALDAEAARWEHAVAAAGVARIALFTREGWDFAAALLGVWRAGASVLLPGDVLPDTCAQLLPHVEAFAGDFPDGLGRPHLRPTEATLTAGAAASTSARAAASDRGPSLTVFTSGTTGDQAPFPKRLDQLNAELQCLEATFGARVGDAAILATVSHQHIYGLLFKVLWPLCAGRPFVSEPLFFPEALLAAARAHPAFALVASPAHLKRLPPFLAWGEVAGRGRAVFSSGGPLGSEAAEQASALLGCAPVEVYGSSETGGIAWRERSADEVPWRPFADVTLAVDDEAGEGLLRVRSPKLPDDGWLQTADRAALAADGTLTLLGRQDRVVKLEEKRVSLDAVERALRESGLVADARVVVLSAERDQLGAVVQLNPAGEALEPGRRPQALRRALAQKVEAVALPRRFRFVDALPADARGKTSQKALRALFGPPRLNEPELLGASSPGEGSLHLRLRLPASLRAFQGHFPEAGVLPGVVQVDWAQRYGRERLAVEGTFSGMDSVKFQQVLCPGDEVELRLEYLPARRRLKFHYQSVRGTHSSGVLLFQGR